MKNKKSGLVKKILIVLGIILVIFLAFAILFGEKIRKDVEDDAKLSASQSEADMILSGIINYCSAEEMRLQMGNNKEILCDSDISKEDVSKMVILGRTKILEVDYENKKITNLKLETQYGHIFELQDDKMIKIN